MMENKTDAMGNKITCHDGGMSGCCSGGSCGMGGMCGGKMSCGCGMCGGCRGMHGFKLIKVLLLVIILSFVFSAGVRMGELKGFILAHYPHNQMMGGEWDNDGMGMMGSDFGTPVQNQ